MLICRKSLQNNVLARGVGSILALLKPQTFVASNELFMATFTSQAKNSESLMPNKSSPLGKPGSFKTLGVSSILAEALSTTHSPAISVPTEVQCAVIPRLLRRENMLIAGSTGSGKTLAFVLPMLQQLADQERAGYVRQAKRPRVLILVPTRELARQVLTTIKTISHAAGCKVSSCAVLGGEPYGLQKKSLDRLVDVVVASPGRLLQHKEQGNIYFSHASHIVIDEVDTMLTQGFGPDVKGVLRGVIFRHSQAITPAPTENTSDKRIEKDEKSLFKPVPVQVVLATATLTKAVQALLQGQEGQYRLCLSALGGETTTPSLARQPFVRSSQSASAGVLEAEAANEISLQVVQVQGLHRP